MRERPASLGDGTPGLEIVTRAGPGGGPHVKVFDGTDLTGGTLLASLWTSWSCC